MRVWAGCWLGLPGSSSLGVAKWVRNLWLLTIWFFFTYLHLDNTTGMTHLKIPLFRL